MPRIDDLKDLTVPKPPHVRPGNLESRTYRIRLITPMFGGGVEAGTPDPSFPIRPTAVRGHLHFWWRLLNAGMSTDQLRARESEIFGDTNVQSALYVRVSNLPPIQLVDPVPKYGDRFSPAAYALFAAIENGQRIVQEGIEFSLTVEWPSELALNRRRAAQNAQRVRSNQNPLPDTVRDVGPDIEDALRAWTCLGGLGARTRRGCGAITLPDSDASILLRLIKNGLRVFLGAKANSPIEAWTASVADYREFRQSPRGAKHPKTISTRKGPKTIRVPGRSYWPEADSIRAETGCALRPASPGAGKGIPADVNPHDHSTPIVPTAILPAFPRAVLGLPINFHFSDAPAKHKPANANKDPKDVQLEPILPDGTKGERMASPVLTRPIWIDGAWHAGIIVLPGSLPSGVHLRGSHAIPPNRDLQRSYGKNVFEGAHLRSLKPLRGKDNALDALVEFLTVSKKYSEVS